MKVIAALALAMGALTLGSCSLGNLSQGSSSLPVALLYGVSRYTTSIPYDSRPNLIAPRYDVENLGTALSLAGWKVISRIDSEATIAQLRSDVASVQATLSPGQRVLFYWSGHGGNEGEIPGVQDESLIMYGYIPTNNASCALTPSALGEIFSPLADQSANLIFIMDSCYSGGFVSSGAYANGLPDNYSQPGAKGGTEAETLKVLDPAALVNPLADYFAAKAPSDHPLFKPQVWAVSAAGSQEESWETNTFENGVRVGQGIFTRFLVEAGTVRDGRYPADRNLDNNVSLQEAYAYCQAMIELEWNSLSSNKTNVYEDRQFKSHIAGNPLDILLY